MITRTTRSRRGVSYLVTVVLMTLIAVALSTLLYAYFSGWIGERTSSTGPTGALSVDTANAKVTGTHITFNLYVRNVGVGDVKITNTFLTLPNGTVIKAPDSGLGVSVSANPNSVIQPNKVVGVTISVPKNIVDGKYVGWWTIKIVGDDGSAVTVKVLVR